MSRAGAIPGTGRHRSLVSVIRSLFCHHQWDMSRSRKGAYVCRRCGARRD